MQNDRRALVFDQALRVGVMGSSVVIICPQGERIALTLDAAQQSHINLLRASADLRHRLSMPSNVIRGRFGKTSESAPGVAHPVRPRWRLRHANAASIRLITGLVALPLVAGFFVDVIALALVTLLPATLDKDIFPWLLLAGVLLSVPASWFVAPLLFDREARREHPPRGVKLSVVPRMSSKA